MKIQVLHDLDGDYGFFSIRKQQKIKVAALKVGQCSQQGCKTLQALKMVLFRAVKIKDNLCIVRAG